MTTELELERDKLINLFEERQVWLRDDRAYYESMARPATVGITVPPQMSKLLARVGYPRLLVNSIAERLELEGFRIGGDPEYNDVLWDYWSANELSVESTLGHTDALVYGRSYVTISAPDDSIDDTVPVIRVEPPTSLFAVIDPRTRQVTKAVRVIYDDYMTTATDPMVACTVYLPNSTTNWVKESGRWSATNVVNHNLGMVPVVPLSNRTQLSDLYGTSEITPELRSVTDNAARVSMCMSATAELMAIPQRVIMGISPEEIGVDPATGESAFDAYLARILVLSDPDSKIQQFNAAELRNYTEVLRELAKQAASYTGLPPQYLNSGSNDNPASAEAIRASEARLVKTVERKQLVFGAAWESVMRVAHKVMNPDSALPPEFFRMETAWRDAATPTFASKADAVTKLFANGTGIIPKRQARLSLGYSLAEIENMELWDKEADPLAGMADATVYQGPTAVPSAG